MSAAKNKSVQAEQANAGGVACFQGLCCVLTAENSCFWSGQAAQQLALCSEADKLYPSVWVTVGFAFVWGVFDVCDFGGFFVWLVFR